MRGKNYVRLGKTKLVRIPQGLKDWVKKIGRELDTKENPQKIMDLLLEIATKTR